MANYNTLFSMAIPNLTPEEETFARDALKPQDDGPFEWPDFSWEVEEMFDGPTQYLVKPTIKKSLWIYGWTDGPQNHINAIQFLEEFSKRFRQDKCWVLEWAQVCSKPELNGFGGGVAVIYKGETHLENTGTYVNDWIAGTLPSEVDVGNEDIG